MGLLSPAPKDNPNGAFGLKRTPTDAEHERTAARRLGEQQRHQSEQDRANDARNHANGGGNGSQGSEGENGGLGGGADLPATTIGTTSAFGTGTGLGDPGNGGNGSGGGRNPGGSGVGAAKWSGTKVWANFSGDLIIIGNYTAEFFAPRGTTWSITSRANGPLKIGNAIGKGYDTGAGLRSHGVCGGSTDQYVTCHRSITYRLLNAAFLSPADLALAQRGEASGWLPFPVPVEFRATLFSGTADKSVIRSVTLNFNNDVGYIAFHGIITSGLA